LSSPPRSADKLGASARETAPDPTTTTTTPENDDDDDPQLVFIITHETC
jgi:hypothetical protein